MLVLGIAGWWPGWCSASWRPSHGGTAVALVVVCVLVIATSIFVLAGLTPVSPGRARVLQLLGRYGGTIRTRACAGSTRSPAGSRSPPGSVTTRRAGQGQRCRRQPDRDRRRGRLAGRATPRRRVFEVDDFVQFVAIQTETAVRHIASSYPYDIHSDGEESLRDNTDEITEQLSAEIDARVTPGRRARSSSRGSPSSPTPRRSPRRCCVTSRPARSSRPGSRSSKARSAWSQMALQQLSGRGRRRAGRGAQSHHGQQPARGALRRPGHPTGRQYRLALPVSYPVTGTERKNILLRLDPAVHDALARWASDDLRSTNAQIEFLLRRALDERRLPPTPTHNLRSRPSPVLA